ncbi:hypothetical protein Rhopal_007876-T1 [Rhodotorula paludigena]|uniref:DUF7729 domain-containing protein n=1 Tax=Rhodotorula paludigena TaxID=86838 RepID=A0AAV5GXU8_9BASI|nr:hypothetical protein Rhopal_007876-T1 [Rhodotorula paludigena]
MPSLRNTATALVAALALAAPHADAPASSSSPASSSPAASGSAGASGSGSAAVSGASAGAANRTASATAAVSTASSTSSDNPLIPSTTSSKCEAFLTDLNSHADISACTAPLLSALALFQPDSNSAAGSYSASSDDVDAALSSLCYTPACDDSLVRSLLTQFNGNCSTELQRKDSVVLGSYDALYVLTPLRTAVCTTDANADFCLKDITTGTMPKQDTGSNATALVSSVASSYAAVASGAASAPAAAASSSAAAAPAQNFRVLAASDSDFSIDVPAPPSLYIQITRAARRFVRRQWDGAASGSGSSSSSASAPAASASGSASATSSTNSTSAASNSTSAFPQIGDTAASTGGVHNYTLPSILPNADTWASASLPFLFLSPSMSSTVLCSQCTKQVLAAYIAWESRMPYALGLANSPLLQGQAGLWTATGEKCGGGFLESVAKQAGESNLTGGAAMLGQQQVVGAALVGAIVMALVFVTA